MKLNAYRINRESNPCGVYYFAKDEETAESFARSHTYFGGRDIKLEIQPLGEVDLPDGLVAKIIETMPSFECERKKTEPITLHLVVKK